MTICRHYSLIAKDGSQDHLAQALHDLAGKIRPLPGCEGVELYQDTSERSRFIFIERWASMNDHKAGGQFLGKQAFTEVTAAVSAPPVAMFIESRLIL
jgi:quinol monooxygenase YgiN